MMWTGQVGDRVCRVELTHGAAGQVEASVDGRRYSLNVTEPQPRVFSILENGVSTEAILHVKQGRCRVRIGQMVFEVSRAEPGRAGQGGRAGTGRTEITAVMPGRVLRVLVAEGDAVTARQGLVVLEAMKMENELTAPRDGVVRQVRARPGGTVESGDLLIVLE